MTKTSKAESLKLEIMQLSEEYGFELKEDGCIALINGSEKELRKIVDLMRKTIKNGSLEPR